MRVHEQVHYGYELMHSVTKIKSLTWWFCQEKKKKDHKQTHFSADKKQYTN